MSVPDFWETDLRMLEIVVKLQASHGGTFPLDILIDHVSLLHPAYRVDIDVALTPWGAAESLRRLAEAHFIRLTKETGDPETEVERLVIASFELWGSEKEAEIRELRRGKQHYIEEAFYRGVPSSPSDDTGGLPVSAHWHEGRFYINGVQQSYSLRATPDGLRRVGAWPNPEVVTEELIAIVGDIAESIEGKRPEDAKTLRQIGRVLKANAIEVSAAVLAKLLEHAAGLGT